MACVNPDGSVTATAEKIIRALEHPLALKVLGEAVKVPQFVLPGFGISLSTTT
jgi:hypothetical protein